MVFLIIHCLTFAAKFPDEEFYQSMLRDEMPSSRPVRQGVLVEIKGSWKHQSTWHSDWLLLTKVQDTTGDGQHVIAQVPREPFKCTMTIRSPNDDHGTDLVNLTAYYINLWYTYNIL